MFWVIMLTFHGALRTCELIKLEKRDFHFGYDDDKKYVVVTLREPKTRKKQPDLTQQVVFRFLPNTSFTPYEVCASIYKRFKSQHDSVFPMQDPYAKKKRSRFIYSWFFNMKYLSQNT